MIDYTENDDLQDKCFCDCCGAFVKTSECEVLEIDDVKDYFEIACNECYNNLYEGNNNE